MWKTSSKPTHHGVWHMLPFGMILIARRLSWAFFLNDVVCIWLVWFQNDVTVPSCLAARVMQKVICSLHLYKLYRSLTIGASGTNSSYPNNRYGPKKLTYFVWPFVGKKPSIIARKIFAENLLEEHLRRHHLQLQKRQNICFERLAPCMQPRNHYCHSAGMDLEA